MLYAVFRSFSLAAYLAGYPAFTITGYPAAVSGIRPDTGYKKRPDYPAGYMASRISGASLKKGNLLIKLKIYPSMDHQEL